MIDDPQENFNVAGESAYAEVKKSGKGTICIAFRIPFLKGKLSNNKIILADPY